METKNELANVEKNELAAGSIDSVLGDISEELERTFSAMTREEQEGIIRRISEEKCRENVNRLVRQNFERIKQEVWNIIVTENEKLPNPHDLDRTKKSSEE